MTKMNPNFHVVLPDVHIPFHDKWALRHWLQFVEDRKPGVIHIIGDLIDAYGISRYDKNPARKSSLQREVDLARAFLTELRRITPDADIRYSEGNHEDRLRKILWGRCKELAGIRCLDIPTLLGLDELGITYHRAGDAYSIGGILFTHGSVVRSEAGQSARQTARRGGTSVIMGHTHRLGYSPQTTWTNTEEAWECGCLCRLDLDYLETLPNWQQGWLTITYLPSGPDVQIARVVGRRGHRRILYAGQEIK